MRSSLDFASYGPPRTRVRIRIDAPLKFHLRHRHLKTVDELSELSIPSRRPQGTVFRVSSTEADCLERLAAGRLKQWNRHPEPQAPADHPRPGRPLALKIQAVLDEDLVAGARLMQPAHHKHALATHTLDGYCAAATAAYFHLSGGRERGLQPMQHTDRRGNSHWWICKNDDRIVDLVYRRDEASTYHHYRRGVPKGFTNCGYDRVPKRAQEIIDRLVARRDDYGSEASECGRVVRAHRQNSPAVSSWKRALRRPEIDPSDEKRRAQGGTRRNLGKGGAGPLGRPCAHPGIGSRSRP